MDASVLIIEDDRTVQNLFAAALKMGGYRYYTASDGESALRQAAMLQPDMYILDLGLPDLDGMEIIRRLRGWTNRPIVVVSARTEVTDKIDALDAGADDYLTKPFSVEELLARIRVALRKASYDDSGKHDDPVFVNGNLTIDFGAGTVSVAGREIHLTPIEYRLLTLLAKNVGKVLTHNYILRSVWQNSVDTDTQSLRVFMASLRKKIETYPDAPQQIQTHVGIGYRMMRQSNEDE